MNFDAFLIVFILSPLWLSLVAAVYVFRTKKTKLFEEMIKVSLVGQAGVLLLSLVYAAVLSIMYVQSSGECMFFSCLMPFMIIFGLALPLFIATVLISGVLTLIWALIKMIQYLLAR